MLMGEKCQTSLKKAGRVLKCLRRNLVDAVWSNPPPPPCTPMRVHPLQYAGKSSTEKISDLRSSLKSQKADAQLVCALDEVAWLLNVRGNDIPNTPITMAYLLILAAEDIGGDGSGSGSGCTLFVDESKLTNEVRQHLPTAEVCIRPYCQTLEAFEDVVKMLECPPSSAATEAHGGVLIDRAQMNLAMTNVVPEGKRVYQSSPITLMKAIKNEAELKGLRDCHVRDGAALTAFLAWLDEAVHLSASEGGGGGGGGGEGVGLLTEDSICAKLESYRKAQLGYVEPSFPTIAGFGPNGAVIHYHPTPEVGGIIHTIVFLKQQPATWSLPFSSCSTTPTHFPFIIIPSPASVVVFSPFSSISPPRPVFCF